MTMNPEDPHPLTQTDEWSTLSPHEKRDRMQAHIREELAKDIAEEQASMERLALASQQLIDALESSEAKVYLPARTNAYDVAVANEVKIETWIEQGLKDLVPYVDEVKENSKLCLYEDALRNISSITRIESDNAADFFFALSHMRKIAIKALKDAEEL